MTTSQWCSSVAAILISLSLATHLEGAAGTSGAAFLEIPVGAGPAAMGSAYTALANDAYAPVFNPGALGDVESTQIAGQHLSYLEGIHYEYAGFVHPLATGRALGVSAQYLATGQIAGTDLSGQSIGNFQSHYGAYTLAYGQRLLPSLSAGLALKYIEASIADVSAHAYGADAGFFYTPTSRLRLAAVVNNLGSPLTFIEQKDALPLAGHLGAAYEAGRSLLLSAETIYRKSGPASARFGLQWTPVPPLSLRVGYRTDTLKGLDPIAGFSTGIGLHVWGQELAYAWVPYGDLGNSQYLSFILHFGQKEEPKRNLIQYQTIKKHRTAKNADELDEPEYQQLLQLLNADDRHVAALQAPEDH